MNKKNVIVLYGGMSTEHEISKLSAATIISNMPEYKYNPIPVYITTTGKWLMYDGSIENIKNIQWEKLGTQVLLSTDLSNMGLLRIVGEKVKTIPVDVVFPVLHGINGEDGSIQGLLELTGLDYVGCGVLASAIAMDKSFTKIIAKNLGLEQAPYLTFTDEDLKDLENVTKTIRYKIGYPCFVKPARSGSSVGITKAANKKELESAIQNASMFDSKIIVEKMITGRELECAVLGSGGSDTRASGVGEILAAADFYDYEAKYENAESKTVIPADIPEEVSERIREAAVSIFNAIDGFGLSRVDFFWDEDHDKVIFNEINTMPGFTSISMYAALWNKLGITMPELIDTLIEMTACRK